MCLASGIALGPLIEATVAAVGGLRGESWAGMEKDMAAGLTAGLTQDRRTFEAVEFGHVVADSSTELFSAISEISP